jgi:nicotinamidase/pyrazinamidase
MSALILVDIQNDFLQGGTLAVLLGNDILPLVNQLMSYPFKKILATKDFHPKNHVSFASTHQKPLFSTLKIEGVEQHLWPDHCVQNTFGSELSADLNQEKIERIFLKGTDRSVDSYSAFYDNAHLKSTGLATYLKENHITDVYLVGLATDYCVKFTALDAVKEGFNTFVILEGCRGVNIQKDDSKNALKQLQDLGVHIVEDYTKCAFCKR